MKSTIYSYSTATDGVNPMGQDSEETAAVNASNHPSAHGEEAEARYQRIKRKLQLVLDENGRIADQLERHRASITRLRREKRILLDRLGKRRATDGGQHDSDEDAAATAAVASDEKLAGKTPNIVTANAAMVADARYRSTAYQRVPTADKTQSGHTLTGGAAAAHTTSAGARATLSTTGTGKGVATSRTASSGRARRNRRVITETRRVQPIPRDDDGKPILPLQVGILTVLDLGTVEHERTSFHNERYIWPVGYTVQRPYASMKYADRQTTYTCIVRDGGDGPRFILEPEDQPDGAIEAATATGAWTTAVRIANRLRQRDHSNSASGPDYFGFSHPTIAKLIQELPSAERCAQYVFQRFEEMKTRRAPRSRPGNPSYTPRGPRATDDLADKEGSEHAGEEEIDEVADTGEEEEEDVDDIEEDEDEHSPSKSYHHPVDTSSLIDPSEGDYDFADSPHPTHTNGTRHGSNSMLMDDDDGGMQLDSPSAASRYHPSMHDYDLPNSKGAAAMDELGADEELIDI